METLTAKKKVSVGVVAILIISASIAVIVFRGGEPEKTELALSPPSGSSDRMESPPPLPFSLKEEDTSNSEENTLEEEKRRYSPANRMRLTPSNQNTSKTSSGQNTTFSSNSQNSMRSNPSTVKKTIATTKLTTNTSKLNDKSSKTFDEKVKVEGRPPEISTVIIPASTSSLLKPKVFPLRTVDEIAKDLNTSSSTNKPMNIDKQLLLQNLRDLKETCKGNVWTLPPTEIALVLDIPEKEAVDHLKSEFHYQNFYWEMVKAGFVHKYLANNNGSSDYEKGTRDVLLYALKCDLPEELRKKIEAAVSKVENPYKKLITHLESNPEVKHLSQLEIDLETLLRDALNVESIQCPPSLIPRVTVLFDEAQLKKRILNLLKSQVAEIIDADVIAAIRDHVFLGLSEELVKKLQNYL